MSQARGYHSNLEGPLKPRQDWRQEEDQTYSKNREAAGDETRAQEDKLVTAGEKPLVADCLLGLGWIFYDTRGACSGAVHIRPNHDPDDLGRETLNNLHGGKEH